ncbi:MAG: RluA family pseudouridine synthase [Thermomicrobiales bacterium]|nr:RluA family pseudouridine synthase [Thermomicrobiales bacterium]
MNDRPEAVDGADEEEVAAEPIELRPTREQVGERLDRFVADALPELSRSYVQQLIERGAVAVDGMRRKPKFKMTPGQVVTVTVPPVEPEEIVPEAIPLCIVYEDRDVLVIDKPAGLVVHPAPGHPRGTLVNAIVHHAPDIALAGSNRPGIIHRLDKDTSGLIAIAKTDRARTVLVPQWEERTVRKTYLALVAGDVPEDEATIDAPIGRDPAQRQRMAVQRTGRLAITHFRVLERFGDATLLEVDIETGRTHQIRVHLAFIGHPAIGDAVYGRGTMLRGVMLDRQFLHASTLGFKLPDGRTMVFSAPLPGDLRSALDALRTRGPA